MKQFRSALLIFLVALAIGCGSKKTGDFEHTWSESERDLYLRNCKSSAAALGDRANSYCECSMEKLEIKYPKEADIGNLSTTETEQIAKECLK